MMKAFLIGPLDLKKTQVDLGYDFNMPQVECLECEPRWKSWGDGMIEFPALDVNLLNKKEFTFERVVTVDEFHRLKTRIERAAGRSLNLVPGCSLGELAGEAFVPKLDDIVWGGVYPQMSKRARDLLVKEGIHLTTAECSIHYRGKKIGTHLAVQIEPVALLTEECRKSLGITYCSQCGGFKYPRPTGARRQPGVRQRRPKYLIRRSAWPKGQHLVTIQETLDVIASPAFTEAIRKLNLKEIDFTECGRYV